jgi:hypothetical protein
MQRLEISES